MSGVSLVFVLIVGGLMFVAGRRSVRRQFNHIKNSSRHSLVVRLDDDRCLHIEDAE